MHTSNEGPQNRHRPKIYDAFCFSICWRMRSSCSLSSGVNSASKSSASNTWRISTSSPPSNGARFNHSTASSIERTCHSQKPAISSFDSVNGPSITVRVAPENFTRLPLEEACKPSPASIIPAFASCSLNLPISARRSLLGNTPASESLLALTITITRIGISPVFYWELGSQLGTAFESSLYYHVER